MLIQPKDEICLAVNQLLKLQKPFVFYRKSGSNQLVSLIQNDMELYTTDVFTESGFVMAPFDIQQNIPIIIPLSKSHLEKFDLSALKMTTVHSSMPEDTDESAKESHIDLVQKTIDYILEGSVNKIVISRMLSVLFSKDKVGKLFEDLLKVYPDAMVSIWYHPKVGLWLGATPERLLLLEKNEFSTMSLAGTQLFTDSVVWRTKEKEEQKWVTDFIIDQLLPIIDNIEISKPFTAKAGHLAHLKTIISGELASGFNLKNLIKALHPTPAVCGSPRNSAKNFILKNEAYDREFYTGFLGELNMNNTTDLYVNLRCMQLKDRYAKLYVGGGITKDSNPLAEWEETVNKAKVLKQLL